MCLSTDRARLPVQPQGLVQSKTARCSGILQGHGAPAKPVDRVDLTRAKSRQLTAQGLDPRPRVAPIPARSG
jgi:hypothetical protein